MAEAEGFFKVVADQNDNIGQFNYGIALSQLVKSAADLCKMPRYFKLAADQNLTFGHVNYAVFLLTV
jgi:hypothetical protein